jgi:hypothetical protein
MRRFFLFLKKIVYSQLFEYRMNHLANSLHAFLSPNKNGSFAYYKQTHSIALIMRSQYILTSNFYLVLHEKLSDEFGRQKKNHIEYNA